MRLSRRGSIVLAFASVVALALPLTAGATGQLACTLVGTVTLGTQSDLRAAASGTGGFTEALSTLTCAGAVIGQGDVDAGSSFCFTAHNGGGACEDGGTSNIPNAVYGVGGNPLFAHVQGSASFSGFSGLGGTPASCAFDFDGHGGPGFGELVLDFTACGTAADGVAVATFVPLLEDCADGVKTCFTTVVFSGSVEA